MNKYINKINYIFYFIFLFFFTGCETLSNGMADKTNKEMASAIIEISEALHSIISLIGVILLSYTIYFLFFSPPSNNQSTGIGIALKGILLFVLSCILISFKYIVAYMFGP